MTTVLHMPTVESILAQRGQVAEVFGDPSNLLIPLDRQPAMPGVQIVEFLRLCGRRGFRKLSRELITRAPSGVSVASLRPLAGDRVEEYLGFLAEIEVCAFDGTTATLSRSVDNFGHTVEWYVKELFEKKLGSGARWGVKLSDVRFGSDYDVLANLGGRLAYVEVKTSSPDDVTTGQLANFLERAQELAPELAVLLVDTDTSLDESGLYQRVEELIMTAENSEVRPLKPDRNHLENRWGYIRLYICNSEPKILTQLQRAVRNYHREVRDYAILKGEPRDFIAAAARLAESR